MNKGVLVLCFCLLFSFVMEKTTAQVKTAFGDETATLDGIIKAYYDVVCVKKGEKLSYQRDSSLHIPGAMIGYVEKDKNGKKVLSMMDLKAFHRLGDAGLEKEGFYEYEIGRKTEKFGNIYHVWSTYESMHEPGGKLIGRGINSIELYYDGKRFWIVSWIFDTENNGNSIPKEYLNTKG